LLVVALLATSGSQLIVGERSAEDLDCFHAIVARGLPKSIDRRGRAIHDYPMKIGRRRISWTKPYRFARWMVADSAPYLTRAQMWDLRNLRMCWSACGFTQQNMSGLVNVIELADAVNRHGVAGAFVECGVWRGGCAGILAQLAAPAGRVVWLFDSFE